MRALAIAKIVASRRAIKLAGQRLVLDETSESTSEVSTFEAILV